MPNLLAHYGAQGAVSRTLFPDSDVKWLLLGCVLPDVPWVLRRAVQTVFPAVDPYQLRLYAIVQASLFGSLLLAAALSLLSTRPRRIFSLLALNSFLALLLDGLQTKWGNGVHLLAPFDWRTWNAELFWPESPLTYLLTAFGIGVCVWLIRYRPGDDLSAFAVRWTRLATSGLLLSVYLVLPFPVTETVQRADPHYIETLRERSRRPGRYVEFDRSEYLARPGADRYRTFAGEELVLRSEPPDVDGAVSLRGRFVTQDTLSVLEVHEHHPYFRTWASVAGLLLLGLVWGRWALRRRGDERQGPGA